MTYQTPDQIIYDGRELELHTHAMPSRITRELSNLILRVPDDMAIVIDPNCFTTACFRNYLARWRVENGVIWLVDVRGIYRLWKCEAIQAKWFTGELRMPTGKRLRYVHGGFGETPYESMLLVSVKNGMVTNEREVVNVSESAW